MKKIIFFLLIVFSCQSTYSQNVIRGKISNHSNEVLTGVAVFLPQQNKGTISDADGNYQISNIPDGEIVIQFSFLGYKNKIEKVYLDNNEVELNITLIQSILETEEIVVSGGYNTTQHENAVKIEILKLTNISNATTQNFMEILTRVPGIDMISKGNGVAKPVIRGLSMNDILVLNNGVRFENYQYSDHHPLGIDEFGIEKIEILKGPASLLYGSDAIGGVINFIKEKPAPIGKIVGDYNLQLFSNSLGMTNNLGIKGSSKKLHGGIRFGNKTNADYLQGGGDFVPNTRFSGNSLKTNVGFNNQNMSLDLFYDYSSYDIGLAAEDVIESIIEQGRGRKVDAFYMFLDNHLISSRNQFFFNKLRIELNSAYQNSSLVHGEEIEDVEIDMKLETITYETRFYLPSTEKNEYIIGIQGLNQINTNRNNREVKLLPDAEINNYSAFGLLQFTFFEKMKLQSGIRYDYKSITTQSVNLPEDFDFRPSLSNNYGSFSGSFGATYNQSEKLLFRANFAAAYRTPSLAELTSNGFHESRYELGNKDLIPQKAYETDASIHFHSDNLTFDIAAFYNLINDYIYITPTLDTSFSGDKIYKYKQTDAFLSGGEAGLHFHPQQIDWLHFETTYSKVTGKQKNGDYLPFIPADKIKIELRVDKEKLGFLQNAFIKINSNTALEKKQIAEEETFTDNYSIFDLGFGADIKLQNQLLSIGLGITNILDTKYIDHLSTLKEVGYFNSGRNLYLSIKIPFGIN